MSREGIKAFGVMTGAGELLGGVRQLISSGQKTDGLDLIFDSVEDLLFQRSYDRVREVLRLASQSAKSEDLPLSAFFSLLAVTLPWHIILCTERMLLFSALRERVVRELGEQGVAELQGLILGASIR